MNPFRICLIALSLCVLTFAATSAMAADGSLTITSPANGAVLDSGSGIKLDYNIHLSPTGNHIHVYVDDQPPIIDRDVSGCPCALTLPDLAPGKHQVVMKEATVHHELTGLQATVTFSVK